MISRPDFNPGMLMIARMSRLLSQTELAKQSKMSQSKVSKIEAGLVHPSQEEIFLFSSVLDYREEFFYLPYNQRPMPMSYHRKKQKLSAREWERIYARSEVYRVNLAQMLRSVELVSRLPAPPAIDPDQYGRRVGEIAQAVRQHWLVPRGPINNLSRIVEDSGIIIISFDFGSEYIDGFCQHANDNLPPLIFVNSRQPVDKLRFTLAHELGHLVMHRLPHPEMEREANEFAGEFLMPTADIGPMIYNMSIERLKVLKMHWKTSMQSILYRALAVGRISERSFRYYFSEMTRLGYRTSEPVQLDATLEKSSTFRQLIDAHFNDLGYTVDDMSEHLGLKENEVRLFYAPQRHRLRLVVGG